MSELDRITFGTDGWRDHRDAFTEPRVAAVARAFASYLVDDARGEPRVAIGFDARRDSDAIASTIAETLADAGFDCWLADADCPTPAIASAVESFDLAGGVMVTASHNPPAYNGIKLIPFGGAPALPTVTDAIESGLGDALKDTASGAGAIERYDFIDYHLDTVLDRAAADLDGRTIAVDAMHGSGRTVTPRALERAGADVIRLRCDRADDFGGIAPEPTAERLETLEETVREGAADLGVANDGDADRVAIVTPNGFVNAHLLFALMYEELLYDAPGPAVRTVSTTFLIDRIAEAHGESVHETAVGFKWVADAMERHDALIGGEESGGFSVRGHVREKDGPLAALLLAGADAERSIDDRLESIRGTYGEVHQITESLPCPNDRKEDVLTELEARSPESIAGRDVKDVNETDGLKFLLENGSWILIRPSGTEPKLRVYAEAESPGSLRNLIDAATGLIEPMLGD